MENQTNNTPHMELDDFPLPFPTVLVGSGMACWDNRKHAICPACGNGKLKVHEYCLYCDRWGASYHANK